MYILEALCEAVGVWGEGWAGDVRAHRESADGVLMLRGTDLD